MSKKSNNHESLSRKYYKALIEQVYDGTKDVDEWHEAMKVAMEDGSTINFNAIPDDSDLVMNSIRYPPHTGLNLPTAHNPNSRCTTTPVESKMEDVKTVTHDGQVYQIGGVYLAKDTVDGEDIWTPIRLIRIDPKSKYPFRSSSENGYGYKCITAVQSPQFIGTITPAPIRLVNGKAYTFDYLSCTDIIGLYNASRKRFLMADGCELSTQCTNIRPMAVVDGVKS